MSEFFDFDPVTGITDTWEYDEETGTAIIHRSQDVEAILKVAAASRREGLGKKSWKKDDTEHYATIPVTVEFALMKKGIDITRLQDPEMDRRFTQEIETNYPLLKGTEKHAWRPK